MQYILQWTVHIIVVKCLIFIVSTFVIILQLKWYVNVQINKSK